MKILIATDNYYPNVNGASYAAQRLARTVADAGHEVLVLAPARAYADERFEHDGISVHGIASMPFERIRVPIPFIVGPHVRRAIAAHSPDIVHIESHFSLGRHAARAARRQGIPLVATSHFMPENLLHYLPITDPGRRITRYLMWCAFLRVFRMADAVTTPTKTAAALLAEIGLTTPVEALSNGIDTERFRSGIDGSAIRKRYGFPEQPLLLYVGRLDKEKHLDDVIRAFAITARKVSAHLVLTGTGPEESALKALAADLGIAQHISFTGFVSDADLPSLYAAASVFVMAGTAELQSLVTMEAMATGLPVVGVNAVALPELIHDGENGYLFAAGDIAHMAAAMTALCSDERLRARMGAASLEIIKAHAMPEVVRRVIALYERTLNAWRSTGG